MSTTLQAEIITAMREVQVYERMAKIQIQSALRLMYERRADMAKVRAIELEDQIRANLIIGKKN